MTNPSDRSPTADQPEAPDFEAVQATWPGEYETGLAHEEAGDKQAAADAFAKAVTLAGDDVVPELLHDAGAAQLALGNDDEADDYLRRAVDGYGARMDIDDDMPHQLYGQARSYALLGERQPMLDALALVVDMEDRYAPEAQDEPDFIDFQDDDEFMALIAPVADAVRARLFRGHSLRRDTADPEAVALITAFTKAAALAGWLPDSAVAAAFDDPDGDGASPQARWRSPSGDHPLAAGLELHADTRLMMLALLDPRDTEYAQQLRLTLAGDAGPDTIDQLVSDVAGAVAAVHQRDAWTDVVAAAYPHCAQVELEIPGGDRLPVALDQPS